MTRHPIGWVIALAGLWKLISAFTLGYTALGAALWNAVIVGVLLIGLGIWIAKTANPSTVVALYWASTGLGVWIFISPWVFGYSVPNSVVSNDVLTGGIVAALAGWFGLFLGPRFSAPA